jgi:hypothetical protein
MKSEPAERDDGWEAGHATRAEIVRAASFRI